MTQPRHDIPRNLGLPEAARGQMDDILQAMYNAHAIKEVSEAQLLETAFQDDNIFYYLAGRLGSEGVSNWYYTYHRDVPIIENLGGLPANTLSAIGTPVAGTGTTITFRGTNTIPYGFHRDSVFFHNNKNYVVTSVNGNAFTIREKVKATTGNLIGTTFADPTQLELAQAFGYDSVANATAEGTPPASFGAVLYGVVIEEGADKTNFYRSPTTMGANLLTIQQYYVGSTDLQSIQSMQYGGSEWQRNFKNMMKHAARNRERLLFVGAGHVNQAPQGASSGLPQTSGLIHSETRGLLNGDITRSTIGVSATSELTYDSMWHGFVNNVDRVYEGTKTEFTAIATNKFLTSLALWVRKQADAGSPIIMFENEVYGIKATGLNFGSYSINFIKSPVYNQIRREESRFVIIDPQYLSITHGAGNGKSLKSIITADVQPKTANMTWMKYYDTCGLKNIREEATFEFTFRGIGW